MLDTDLHDKLIAFLEAKPAGEAYIYEYSHSCAAAQFNASIGREYPMDLSLVHRESKDTFDGMLEGCAVEKPRTFGDLLDRVRKLENA